MLTASVSAQQNAGLSTDERTEKRLERLTTQLSLTPEQANSIRPIVMEMSNLRNDFKNNRDQDRKIWAEKRKKLEQQLISKLTPEQRNAYDAMREAEREKIKTRKGK